MGGKRGEMGSASAKKRLVCVVEGRGEVEAVPCLCSLIRNYLEAWDWFVDPEPVRSPRARLVDERVKSPHRPPRSDDLVRVVEIAARRPGATAVLVLCDSDDDCPVSWGPPARELVQNRIRGGAVMAVREYEVWLLTSLSRSSVRDGRRLEEVRDAKALLAREIGEYTPTVHQLKQTRAINLDVVWACSESFDTLVRTLAMIFGVSCPPRPRVP
jgi:hypothetical protein